ncbi:MAG: TolC family protein [Gammaproteobacteria bacterium]|nr:TolC family protein [Gammaproteobacteria bacterium]
MRSHPEFLLRLLALPLLAASAFAQTGPTREASAAIDDSALRPVPAVIEDYVKLGLGSNLALQSATLEVERSEAALDAARGRFFPEATLGARYTRSEGGREVSLPLGSALNPIYLTLNELLATSGKPPRFGLIEDPRFLLQREREQDTRISVRQPLYAPAIPAAVRAQRSLLEANEFARLAVSNRLRRDITVGYLDWLRASRSARLIDASRALLAENLRINESLFRNGKVTQDQVLRAQAELLAVEQQLTEASNVREQLQSYVNFLLNRPLETPLEAAETQAEVSRTVADLAALRVAAANKRPEYGQVDRAVRAAGARVDATRAARKPTLALGIDGGTQGEEYAFGSGRNFATVSVLLNWTLFDGGTRRAEVRQARVAQQQAELQREQVSQQIQLEVQQTLDRLQTSEASLRTAEARAAAARAVFRIAGRKRDEGVISQVEFLDARTSLTAAELNLNAVRFEVLARQAELDYATGATLP